MTATATKTSTDLSVGMSVTVNTEDGTVAGTVAELKTERQAIISAGTESLLFTRRKNGLWVMKGSNLNRGVTLSF